MAERIDRLDCGLVMDEEIDEALKLDFELNRLSFDIVGGLNQLPLVDECRALDHLEDFDYMYDVAMQMLHRQAVQVFVDKTMVCEFLVTDRYMDLGHFQYLREYPLVVRQLVRYISRKLSKKYPLPLSMGAKTAAAKT